jgi:hypothetical protein
MGVWFRVVRVREVDLDVATGARSVEDWWSCFCGDYCWVWSLVCLL